MNAIACLTALTIALTVAAAPAAAQSGETLAFEAPTIETGAASGVRLGDTFTMDVWAKVSGEGYLVGHPGRASVEVLDGSVVFTIGGDASIDGIAREAYVVSVPLGSYAGANRTTLISASYDGETMRLSVYGPGLDAPVVAEAHVPRAATMLEQLSVMEELMGGGACSRTLVFGDPAVCGATGAAYAGTVERVEVSAR